MDVVIYSILFSDPKAYPDHRLPPKGAAVLKEMAAVTGGGFFGVSDRQTIDRIFDLIAGDLLGQYSIGYVSDRPVTKAEFRKLTLSTRRLDLVVQARESYFVAKPHR